MKIAIMGAGISGLACAITLKNHGVQADIYESRGQVGDRFVNGEITLRIFETPIADNLRYFSQVHGIHLQPASAIRELVLFTEKERGSVQGFLGFLMTRGRDSQSYEKQMARQLQAPIRFHSDKSYQDLIREYTHVVVATGDAAYAEKLRNFRTDLTVFLKGGTIRGQFDPASVAAWLDHRIAPQGYAYLIPYSETEANAVIAFPNTSQNNRLDAQELLNRFLDRIGQSYPIQGPVQNPFEINRYQVGQCLYPRLGNTLFTGNNLGTIMPFLGFGITPSLLSGIYAAKDLLGLASYEKQVAGLRQSYRRSIVLRHAMENLSNRHLDWLVRALRGRPIHWLFNTRFNGLALAATLLRPFVPRS